MQITSKKGSIVLDYYPIKNLNDNIYQDEVLRVLSFKGETQTKRIITTERMGDEVLDRKDNFDYIITDNSKGLPQFVSHYQRRSYVSVSYTHLRAHET